MFTKWVVDECPDANGHFTIRLDDGSGNGNIEAQPIATVPDLTTAESIVSNHNAFDKHINWEKNGTEFSVESSFVRDGFWITVGVGSIYVRKTDEGISVDIYPVNQEDKEAIASCYVFDHELESD